LHFFGAPCTKKLELALRISIAKRKSFLGSSRLRRPKAGGRRREGRKREKAGRQKFLPQTPSFLPSSLKEPL